MSVIIIGSHGFIGGYLCEKFIKNGWEVIGIDKISMYKPDHSELFLKHYDIRNKTQLKNISKFYRIDCGNDILGLSKIIDTHQPEVIINLASISVADVCKKNTEEAISSIYLLNANILENIKRYKKLKRYVYISSSMVYGDFLTEKPNENSPTNPKDPYGAIKLGGELLVKSFHHQFDLEYSIVRPSAVYGPLDSNMRVSGIFLNNAHHGKSLFVNDLNEKLDFTYVEDTAEGIFLAGTHEKAKNETFNITCGQGRTIYDFAKEIVKYYPQTKINVSENSGEHMEGLIRPNRGGLSIENAKTLIGYNPKFSIEKGIENYVEFWKSVF